MLIDPLSLMLGTSVNVIFTYIWDIVIFVVLVRCFGVMLGFDLLQEWFQVSNTHIREQVFFFSFWYMHI